MATKPDFTPEQWRKLLEAPLLVGFAVSAAAPSGLIGTLLESMASADALAAARSDASELVRAVVDDLLTAEGRTAARTGVQRLIEGAELSEIKSRALAHLGEAARIVDAVAPGEAAAFKNWVAQIAACVVARRPRAVFSTSSAAKRSAPPSAPRFSKSTPHCFDSPVGGKRNLEIIGYIHEYGRQLLANHFQA